MRELAKAMEPEEVTLDDQDPRRITIYGCTTRR